MSNTAEQIEEDNVQQLPAAPRREVIVVTDEIPVLDTGRFEQMQRIATAMARTTLVPNHLRDGGSEVGQANCFLVVNQAVRWRMDPFALAQHAFVVHGRLGYEGKVVAAVVNGHRRLTSKLSYTYEGQGDARKVTISGKLGGETEARTVEGSVKGWKTNNENWTKSPDQMLAYRGAREWARRHMPEAMLGVFTDDELMEAPMRDVTPVPPSPPPAPPAPPAAEQEIIPPKKAAGRKKGEARTDRTPYADKAKQQATDHDPETGEVDDGEPFDPDLFLDDIEGQMAACSDQATLEEVWNTQVEPLVEDGTLFPPDRQKADDIYQRNMDRLEKEAQ